MKKLTAGIFTVLMGLVTVNAAEAAVASKGYVDTKVGANTTSIETLTQTVAQNKTDAVAATKQVADDLAEYETANDQVVSGLGGRLTTAEGNITTLQGAVGALSGNGDGSVAKQIADALAEANGYTDAEVKELADGAVKANTDAIAAINNADTGILKQAQTYADGLAGNYDAAGSAAAAQAAAEKTASDALNAYKTTNDAAVSANTNAISAINNAETGILKQSKDYTDTEIDKLEQSLGNTSTDLTELSGKVTANEQAIQGINDSDVMKSGVTAETVSQVGSNATAIQTINNSAAMNSGITSEKVTAYDNYAGQISGAQGAADAAQGAADAAQADADAAAQAAAAAQATADKAIPAPTPECSNKGNKCVLTSGENGYAWEVIERGTGEVVE